MAQARSRATNTSYDPVSVGYWTAIVLAAVLLALVLVVPSLLELDWLSFIPPLAGGAAYVSVKWWTNAQKE